MTGAERREPESEIERLTACIGTAQRRADAANRRLEAFRDSLLEAAANPTQREAAELALALLAGAECNDAAASAATVATAFLAAVAMWADAREAMAAVGATFDRWKAGGR